MPYKKHLGTDHSHETGIPLESLVRSCSTWRVRPQKIWPHRFQVGRKLRNHLLWPTCSTNMEASLKMPPMTPAHWTACLRVHKSLHTPNAYRHSHTHRCVHTPHIGREKGGGKRRERGRTGEEGIILVLKYSKIRFLKQQHLPDWLWHWAKGPPFSFSLKQPI